jgi:hypothetical protein
LLISAPNPGHHSLAQLSFHKQQVIPFHFLLSRKQKKIHTSLLCGVYENIGFTALLHTTVTQRLSVLEFLAGTFSIFVASATLYSQKWHPQTEPLG